MTKRFIFALILTVLISVPAAVQTEPDQASESLRQARDHLAQDELSSALVVLLDSVQQHPDHYEARHLLATTSLALGHGARAEKELMRAMELGLDPLVGWPLLVRAVFIQGDMARVIEAASDLPPEAPINDRADVLGWRGHAEAIQGQWEKAEQSLRSARAIAEDSVPALLGTALLEGHRGAYGDAQRWIDRALEVDPASADAWSFRGDLALMQGDYDGAARAFTEAVARRPHVGLERARRVLALSQLGRHEDAAADLDALAGAGWGAHPYVRYVAGRHHFAQEQYMQAAEAFEASYSEDARFLPNRLFLAVTRILLGQPEQALVHAQFVASRAARQFPRARREGVFVIRKRRRVAEADASQYEVAERALLAALSEGPAEASIRRLLAAIALAEDRPEQGADHARRLLALEPNAPDARDLLRATHPERSEEQRLDPFAGGLLEALGALQQNDLDQALILARALADRYPSKLDAINLLAAVELRAGHWEKGKDALERSLLRYSDQPKIAINLAKVEMKNGNLDRARGLLRDLDEERLGSQGALLLFELENRMGSRDAGLRLLESVVATHPEAAEVRRRLAAERLADGDLQQVIDLTEALTDAQVEQMPGLLELRGKAQLAAGDLESARQSFERWAQARPAGGRPQFFLAEALARSGDLERAHSAIDRAVKLDPSDLTARIGHVKSLVRRDQLRQARTAVAELKDDFGEHARVLGIEGWLALGSGDLETARRSLIRALAFGSDSELTQLLVRTLWAQGEQEAALATMEQRLEQVPDDLPVLLLLADSYLALDRSADARATYARIVAVYPRHVPALNNLAWLSRDQDVAEALSYARRAQEVAPNDPYVLDTLGNLLLMQGMIEDGLAFLRQAARARPEDGDIQLHLGRALAEQDRVAEARAVLTRLVERDPDTPQAREAREALARLDASPPR